MRMAKPRPRRPSISLGPEPKDIAIPPTANTSSMDCARRVSPVDGTQPFSRDRTRRNNVGVEGSRKHFSRQTTYAIGALGGTRTPTMLLTATSRQRVYQFRHERLGDRYGTCAGPDQDRINGADVTNQGWRDKARRH